MDELIAANLQMLVNRENRAFFLAENIDEMIGGFIAASLVIRRNPH